jgi:hypothetical protein
MTQRVLDRPEPLPAPRARAEAFLESVQQRVYASLGLTADDCQQRERQGQAQVLPERLRQKALELSGADFARYREALLEGLARDEAAPRPTRFERPHQYSILRELQENVERAVARLAFDLPVRALIGTLPTQTLEPLMMRVPDSGDLVIVVDGCVLSYANLLAKAVAQTLPVQVTDSGAPTTVVHDDAWLARLDETGSGRTRFVELMLAALDGRPGGAPAYLPESRYEHVAADVCDFMELFVVAREYGHLLSGDHEVARTCRRTVRGLPVDTLAWTREQELRADTMGLALLLAAADVQGASLAWAFWAADVLLASFAIMERAVWTAAFTSGQRIGLPEPSRHEHRRQHLRQMLRRWEGGEQAVAFAESLQPVLDLLEGSLEVRLYADRAADLAVH